MGSALISVRPSNARRPSGRRALRWHPGERLGYLMVAPAVLALLALTAYPLYENLLNSFRSYNLYQPAAGGGHPFVGFANYRDVFNAPASLGLDLGLGR